MDDYVSSESVGLYVFSVDTMDRSDTEACDCRVAGAGSEGVTARTILIGS